MNLAFFGTSDRSIPILEKLNSEFNLKLVITKPDVKVGRKQELKEVKVKTWAKENNITFIEFDKSEETLTDLTKYVKKYDIKVAIMADFSFIIKKEVINIFEKGIINIHFSLLPKYRGASPVQFAILNGDNKTGVTYYLMDEGMDTGDIVYSFEHKLNHTETSESLYSTLFKKAAENLSVVIKGYMNNQLEPIKQNHNKATYTFSKSNKKSTQITKYDAKINWNDSAVQIERQIRAYIPWPISWTTMDELNNNRTITATFILRDSSKENLKVKIYGAKVIDNKLNIELLQVEGKQIVDWKSFENGYSALVC